MPPGLKYKRKYAPPAEFRACGIKRRPQKSRGENSAWFCPEEHCAVEKNHRKFEKIFKSNFF
jgi:hypothetical protein